MGDKITQFFEGLTKFQQQLLIEDSMGYFYFVLGRFATPCGEAARARPVQDGGCSFQGFGLRALTGQVSSIAWPLLDADGSNRAHPHSWQRPPLFYASLPRQARTRVPVSWQMLLPAVRRVYAFEPLATCRLLGLES